MNRAERRRAEAEAKKAPVAPNAIHCTTCGSSALAYATKPLRDDTLLSCFGCGRVVGTKKVIAGALSATVSKPGHEHFGKEVPMPDILYIGV